MKRISKKLLSLFLALLMFTSTSMLLFTTAFAVGTETAEAEGMTFYTGSDGDQVWRMRRPLEKAPYTISAWIKVPTDIGNGRVGGIISNYDGGSDKENSTYYGNATYGNRTLLFEIHENGQPRFYYGTDSNGSLGKDSLVFDQVDVRTGEWIQLTVVKEADAAVIYVNGVEKQRKSTVMPYHSDILLQPFAFGSDNRQNNNYPFKGSLKGFAMYSAPLTAEAVAKTYEDGAYADDESLLVKYDVTTAPTGDYLPDNSGNNYYAAKKSYISSVESENDIVIGEMGTGDLGVEAPKPVTLNSYAYSFAVVGDTQYMTKYDAAYDRQHLHHVYDWILRNASSKKIKYVFGLGDITDSYNKTGTIDTAKEWEIAYEQISRLNGKLPYSVIRGNHDNPTYMNSYFANDTDYTSQFKDPDIEDQSKCFYQSGSVLTAYTKFTVGNTKYLLLLLDDGPDDAELTWANNVIASNPDYRVIINTHSYLGYTGGHIDDSDTYAYATGSLKTGDNTGSQIWEKLVSQHSNIFLALCGHDYKVGATTILKVPRTGVNGNTVTEMLICPQSADRNEDIEEKGGMVAMLYFSEDGQDVRVEYISTIRTVTKNNGASDYIHQDFTLNLISRDAILDEVKVIRTEGGKSTVAITLTSGLCRTFTVNAGVTVSSVTQASDSALVDVYDVALSDGSTVSFTVTNGNILLSTDGMNFLNPAKKKYQLNSKFETAPQTLEAWIHLPKSTATTPNVIFGNYRENINCLNFDITNSGTNYGVPRIYLRTDNGATTKSITFKNVDVRSDGFVHLAIVFSDSKALCYVNGELAQTVTNVTQLPIVYDELFKLGSDSRNSGTKGYFDGNIGSVTLYSDARTAEEIAEDMQKVDTSDSGIILHYDLFANADELIIQDETGNGNVAISTNYSSSVIPSEDDGIVLPQDGRAENYMLPEMSALPYAMEAWIKVPENAPNTRLGGIFSNYPGNTNTAILLEIYNNGNPRFWYGSVKENGTNANVSLVFDQIDVRTGDWLHLAVVKERDFVICYVNGIEVQRLANSNEYRSDDLALPFVLGGDQRLYNGYSNQYPFRGTFGRAAMYDMPLTAEQIADSYLNGVDTSNPSLMVYYDTCGSNAPDSVSKINDLSGNGNHATRNISIKRVSTDGNIQYFASMSNALNSLKAGDVIEIIGDVESGIFTYGGAETDSYTSASSALRFKYEIDFTNYNIVSWKWNYGVSADALVLEINGSKRIDNETNAYIKGITSAFYDSDVYIQLSVVIEADGVQYTLVDSVRAESVNGAKV